MKYRPEEDYVAKGKLAKEMIEEIQRPPTREEIEFLKKMLSLRLKRNPPHKKS